jgi:hypothetical protein
MLSLQIFMPHMSIENPDEKAQAMAAAAESQDFKEKMGYLAKLLVRTNLVQRRR